MTDLGLVSVIPVSVLVALAALTVSFAISLGRRPLQHSVALSHVLVLVLLLYGVTAMIEPEPRFSTTWRHVGIMDYIDVNRSVDPSIDAYFSWPGFFTLGVLITNVAGLEGLDYTAWGSVAFNLLFLAPLAAIFAWATSDERVVWLGLWVFYSANWVGQDYVAPQAVGFLLWLAALAALLWWFAPRPAGRPPAPSLRALPKYHGARALRALGRTGITAGGAQRVGLLVVVLIIYAATVAGHQLTPFPALLAVSALVILAGLETRALPFIMALVLGAWISYMTTEYLRGHIATISEPLGSVRENVGENVTERIEGSDEHQFIVHIRLYATAAIWTLAAAGFVRRLRGRRFDLALALVGVTPFLLPVLQPYGGEMLLRVFLFSLPAVAFFIARFAYPHAEAGRTRLSVAAIAVLGCLLIGAFQFTRYGNERMDSFTSGDVAAVDALYRHAPPGSQVATANFNMPWRHRRYAEDQPLPLRRLDAWDTEPFRPDRLLRELRAEFGSEGGYVIITRSTFVAEELFGGRATALEQLRRFLRVDPRVLPLYTTADGDVVFVPGLRV